MKIKTIITIIVLIINLISCTKKENKNDAKQFNKVKLVFCNSNDTIVYKNVDMNKNSFILENNSNVIISNLKWYKTETNPKWVNQNDDELNRIIYSIIAIIIGIEIFRYVLKKVIGD